jgi:inositol-phosphate transport system ATP-binding protein
MKLKLENLSKRWGSVVGADNVNLEINDGEFVAFLGPSGCGKTTTLLMIAGIYKATTGTILFDERVVNNVPPKDRNIGMVFQSYALYPHMTVYDNITFPMKLQKSPQNERRQRAQEMAELMGIEALLDRKPGQLSGGQQQRVALARALVKRPDLLLFDEPLSNLDARLRLTMRAEIKRLQLELGITTVYVTHDQVEAITMADRVAVMKAGKLQAFAPPAELYDRPKTLFVAGFVGNPPMNFAEVEVVFEGGEYYASKGAFRLLLPPERGQKAAGRGTVVMGIRPDDVSVAPVGMDGDGSTVTGEVYVVEPLVRDDQVDVVVGENHVRVLADPELGIAIGDTVALSFNTDKVQFFDPITEDSLLWA